MLEIPAGKLSQGEKVFNKIHSKNETIIQEVIILLLINKVSQGVLEYVAPAVLNKMSNDRSKRRMIAILKDEISEDELKSFA